MTPPLPDSILRTARSAPRAGYAKILQLHKILAACIVLGGGGRSLQCLPFGVTAKIRFVGVCCVLTETMDARRCSFISFVPVPSNSTVTGTEWVDPPPTASPVPSDQVAPPPLLLTGS